MSLTHVIELLVAAFMAGFGMGVGITALRLTK